MPSASPAKTAAAAQNVTISTRALTKVYGAVRPEVRALQGVDLDLARGELVVLLGSSDSGKSTLLNIIGGLDVPTPGRVYFEREELTVYDEAELTRFRRASDTPTAMSPRALWFADAETIAQPL
jgi:putative ABC transport system ATP-binding protein